MNINRVPRPGFWAFCTGKNSSMSFFLWTNGNRPLSFSQKGLCPLHFFYELFPTSSPPFLFHWIKVSSPFSFSENSPSLPHKKVFAPIILTKKIPWMCGIWVCVPRSRGSKKMTATVIEERLLSDRSRYHWGVKVNLTVISLEKMIPLHWFWTLKSCKLLKIDIFRFPWSRFWRLDVGREVRE